MTTIAKKTLTPKRTAQDAFIQHIETVRERLALLHNHIENHCGVDPDAVNWAHVGNVVHVENLLGQINDFLGLVK